MKRLYLIIPLFCLVIHLTGQVATYDWVKRAGMGGNDAAHDIAIDESGDVIVVGRYDAETILIDSTSLFSDGSEYLVVKFDPAGNVIWCKTIVGPGFASPAAVATDLHNNIFVTGVFQGSSISFDSITIHGSGSSDIFIAKYDQAGNIIWAKSYGGAKEDNASAIAADLFGNVVITGAFKSALIDFDAYQLTNSDLGTSEFDMFITKFDPAGAVLWVRQVGGEEEETGEALALDAAGNIFVGGKYWGDSVLIETIWLENAGIADMFIAKYNQFGSIQWAKRAGGPNGDHLTSMDTDTEDNLIVTGYFGSPEISFDSKVIYNSDITFDVFLVKFDPAGTVLWATGAGGRSLDGAYAISTSENNDIFITGAFSSDDAIFDHINLDAPGLYDVFLARYDENGTLLWVIAEGGENYEEGYSVATDHDGNAFIVGIFWSDTLRIGSVVLANTDTSGMTRDMFIAKVTGVVTSTEDEGGTSAGFKSWNLYPNPTDGQMIIESSEEIEKVLITDIFGRTVYHAEPHATVLALHLDYPQTYFVLISTSSFVASRKVMVLH